MSAQPQTTIITPTGLIPVISKETMLKPSKPYWQFEDDFDIKEHIKTRKNADGNTVAEFIGTDSFASDWYERQRFEVDQGRDREPLIYQEIYDIVVDASLPRNVSIHRLGPAGVVFEEVYEGGEVKFVSVSGSDISIPIKHYAVGLEYTKDLAIFNEMWNVAMVERQAGAAYNALLNGVHLAPILNHTYSGTANTTAASSDGATVMEKMWRTIENAITAAAEDQANPRYGPYVLLAGPANAMFLQRALMPVPQQNQQYQIAPMVSSLISKMIVYNGWTGVRNRMITTYPGVPANKAYLIDISNRERNFKSMVKQGLESAMGNPDLSRFIMEQVVWDTYFGVFADPAAAVQEINIPTS